MKSRIILAFLCVVGGSVGGPVVVGQTTDSRPNILFIYADDHSPKAISCYEQAYSMANTPNIDALAKTGVRFRAAYLGGWCMASRASLLTGLHPHSIESMRMTGSNPRSTYDPQQCRFWPSVFREHGYQTAQIGKWHTGTDAGFGRDWDFQMVWNRPDNPENAGKYYGPQIIDHNGKRETIKGYATDNYTRWACDYIRGEGRDPNQPWYLWLCYGAIHTPTTPADRHKGLLESETAEVPTSIFGPAPGQPDYLKKIQRWEAANGTVVFKNNPKKTHTGWLQQVNECLKSVDEGVGELIKTLQESGQLENTLVIYTSDQGYANGEHGLAQKVAPYEATYSSPFIASRPGTVSEGKVCPHTVNASDVIVTFFAQAGIELPWEMPGRDFTPLLMNPESAPWDRPTLYTNAGQLYGSDVAAAIRSQQGASHAGVPFYAAIRQHDLKYVRYLVSGVGEELYDLASDPDEMTNLVGEQPYESALRRMRAQWFDELKRARAPYLDVIPPTRES